MFEPKSVDTKSIKVGMLVRNLEGERLGQVVAREGPIFRVQRPDIANAERYVVEDADVASIRGAEIVLRQGPATMVLEREYERRQAAGVPLRVTAEGWRKAGGLEETVDAELLPGMVVADVEGRPIGTLYAIGDDAFDLRCADTGELATVQLGDVLNVLPKQVVVRNGRGVMRNRRQEPTAAEEPLI